MREKHLDPAHYPPAITLSDRLLLGGIGSPGEAATSPHHSLSVFLAGAPPSIPRLERTDSFQVASSALNDQLILDAAQISWLSWPRLRQLHSLPPSLT